MLSELFTGLVEWSFLLIQAYGPYSVFVAVILEEVLVPIPSPLVLMGAGFILIPANLAFWDAANKVFFLIVIPASIASTIGSFFVYGIGYYGGKPLINRFKWFLGISWDDILKQEKKFTKGNKVWATIAMLRAIPFFPIALVSLTAGVLRLNYKKYAIATLIGSIPRTFVLGMIGWQLGSAYVLIAEKLNLVENVLAVAIIIGVVYLLYRFRHKYVHHYRKIMDRVKETRKR